METDEILDAVFMALAERHRRRILQALSERRYTVGELATLLAMPLASVSKHLNLLEKCQLIYKEKTGRNVYCYLHHDTWLQIAAYISQFSEFWKTRLDELEDYINLGKHSP